MKHIFTSLGIAACCAWAVLPAQAAVAGAPAPPTEVVVTFPEGGLYGHMEFTAPKLTVGGEELEGNLTYTVTANNETVAQGQVYPAASISVDLNMPKPAVYEFAVTVANEIGESEPGRFRVGAGFSPAVAPDPKAEVLADGNIKISWPAVTRTINGTSLLNENVTYRVERYPDGHFVELNTPELYAIDDDLDGNLHAYRYYVFAIWNATPGDEAYTNAVVVGSATPPFNAGFETQDQMDLFTVYDLDGDGKTWYFYYGEARAGVSSDHDADDWLISPAINLSKTGYHPVSIDLKLQPNFPDYPALVEVCYGAAPTPEAMTHVAVPAADVVSTTYQTFNGMAKADWNGPVYFGIHNITKADMWYVHATNLKISPSAEGMVPAAATDFKATADIDGAIKIDLEFKAPAKDVTGDPLKLISRIELRRDGVLLHTFTDVQPGETLTYTDKEGEDPEDPDNLVQGEHVYSLIAYNEYGQGFETKVTAFAGINLPAMPGFAKAMETEENGVVRVEWAPVTTYIDGTPLNPDNVTYCIWTNVTGQPLKLWDQLKGTSYTFRNNPEGDMQMFFQYWVTAETSYGENLDGPLTEYIPLGEPYEAPYEDSFPNLKCTYNYVMVGSDPKTFFDNASDEWFEEVTSQDADNGMIYMFGDEYDSSAQLITGKIDLTGVSSPMLTFYVFNYSEEDIPNVNTVEVLAQSGDSDFKSLGTWTLDDFGTEAWHRIHVPLDAYKDRSVRFKIVGTVKAYQYMHIDNLQVRSRKNYDLALSTLSVPERIKSGNECPIIVGYANHGLTDAGEFSIEVLQDGKQVAERTLPGLPTDGRGEVTIPVLHSVLTPEVVSYDVRLNYAPDQNVADNKFDTFEVMTISPVYPTVTDLAAHYGDNPNELTLVWSEPDMSAAVVDDKTEDFETSESWDDYVEGWTFIDVDRQHIYGFEPWIILPDGAPQAMSRQSWWICDASYEPMIIQYGDPQFYVAHSGKKYMISMAVTDEDLGSVRSDDWAISPELPGTAQTISLWAKAMLEDAPETFELLYSTTDMDLDSFETLQTVKNVGWYWTQYFFELPEGAKYFAIRCVSRDAYVLMIDDVNFIPAGKGSDLKVAGYNVYRDHKLLNDTPVATRRFEDVRSDAAVVPTYNVTTLYAGRGESSFSNDARPEYSGIEEIADAVRVSASRGQLTVEGAEGSMVRVWSADGMLLVAEEAGACSVFPLDSGIYLVKVADRSWKVVIR